MTDMGFPIPDKENENRRALIPPDISGTGVAGQLVFEQGYGHPLGYSDDDFRAAGATVADRGAVNGCPIICAPKPSIDGGYFRQGAVLFGWAHAVQGRAITDALIANGMTAIAWEDMFEGGRHCFWRNNEISGEAAVAHAFLMWGRVPYGCSVAVVGRGNVARGAIRTLEREGARVTVFNRRTAPFLREEIGRYDVIVNAVLWDVFRSDHLVYEEDLAAMRPGSMIVDISCDEAMGIESSRPTSIEDPTYWHKGILHYAVDHTPALYHRTATESISQVVGRFVGDLVNGRPNTVLTKATVIENGAILDDRISRFQGRCGPDGPARSD